MTGTLWLCGSPIGNLGDMSDRLKETLATVDVVYAEDTRRVKRLMDVAHASAPVRSYFAGNERQRARQLAADLRDGKNVALVTDAGMPGVGDPGVSAVRAAREMGAPITVIPGPSAVTAAVAVAGMGDRFVFEGFLPRKGSTRRHRIQTLTDEQRPAVLFCSPRRLLDDLADLADGLGGGRLVCVCRELTKIHEEVWWGTLAQAISRWTDNEPRGEFTLVIEGAGQSQVDWRQAASAVQREIESGATPAAAVRAVSDLLGIPKNELYRRTMTDGPPDQ